MDRKDIEPIEKVGTKCTFLNASRQIPVGRGDEPGVGLDGPRTSEAFKFSFPRYAQQLGLKFQRNLPDLVEERSALVR